MNIIDVPITRSNTLYGSLGWLAEHLGSVLISTIETDGARVAWLIDQKGKVMLDGTPIVSSCRPSDAPALWNAHRGQCCIPLTVEADRAIASLSDQAASVLWLDNCTRTRFVLVPELGQT